MDKKNVLQSVKVIILGLILSFGIASVFGQIKPIQTKLLPPSNNVSGPLNEGPSDQVKDGGLAVNAFIARGNALFYLPIKIESFADGTDNKPLCADSTGKIVYCP